MARETAAGAAVAPSLGWTYGAAAFAHSTASARSPSARAACIDSRSTSRGVGPSASAFVIESLVRLPRLPRGLPAPGRGPPFGIRALLLISALILNRQTAV